MTPLTGSMSPGGGMRVLDLYCGAGGAAKGYADAGYEVVGVDLRPQPRYPYAFLQHDVLKLDYRFVRMFDAVHASPPCQFGTALRHAPGTKRDHLNLIPATRRLLQMAERPYIIENVEGVREHLINPVCLCGSAFHLGAYANGIWHELRRHRLFETTFPAEHGGVDLAGMCLHREPTIGVYGGHVRVRSAKYGGRRTRDLEGVDKPQMARLAMGTPWMTMQEMSEAIPPAYTRYLASALLEHLTDQRQAA